ncbi:MAG: DUF4846 domain-containing protein [Bacteroidia bacterium]
MHTSKFYFLPFLSFLCIMGCACEQNAPAETKAKEHKVKTYSAAKAGDDIYINPRGSDVQNRFVLPEGFSRIAVPDNSFAAFLRTVKLKPHGTKAYLYTGELKQPETVYAAVLDYDKGTKDLQQCADAVMRLRGEYFYAQKQYENIHFNFTNGFRCDFTKYAEGNRIVVNGNKVSWVKKAKADYSYASFRQYMDLVFNYAGTLSLEKELKKVDSWEKIQGGDVVIFGGSPGHCVIVMDVCQNAKTGEKRFLIAQSWMPAQDIHVLKNLDNAPISPWYSNRFEGRFASAECWFNKENLKTWTF